MYEYLNLITDIGDHKYILISMQGDSVDTLLYEGNSLNELEDAVNKYKYKYKQNQYEYLDACKLGISNNIYNIIKEAEEFEFNKTKRKLMSKEIKEGESIISKLNEDLICSGLIRAYALNDTYKIAEYLYKKNYRKIDKPGLIACKGGVYIVTPELEEKIFKILNY